MWLLNDSKMTTPHADVVTYLTALVLEPHSDDPGTQPRHLHKLLLQENVGVSHEVGGDNGHLPSWERQAGGSHCSRSWGCWAAFHWGRSWLEPSSWRVSWTSWGNQWGLLAWSLRRDQTMTPRQTGLQLFLKCKTLILLISEWLAGVDMIGVERILQGNDWSPASSRDLMRTSETLHPTPPLTRTPATIRQGLGALILMTATALFSSKIHQSMTAVVTPSYDNNSD